MLLVDFIEQNEGAYRHEVLHVLGLFVVLFAAKAVGGTEEKDSGKETEGHSQPGQHIGPAVEEQGDTGTAEYL